MRQHRFQARSHGFSLIEVLVTILILVIGLLGMFGMQSRASVVEMEAYQRAQALALLKDMESRIRTNRAQFDAAFTAAYADMGKPLVFGTNSAVDCTDAVGAKREVCQWSDVLLGAAETLSAAPATQVGAMIGARGCVMALPAPTNSAVSEFFVVVVWQGLNPSEGPDDGTPAAVCAQDVDFGRGLRRYATARVLVPKLEG
ncbi:type IV pilus modification protein PilV [Methylibium rhizosphaerae]|uniref:type IV pilus modification protein PilV n=1 Tax=Methylibium rhizosphaerae TaxID=2570323 RepID=UPI001129AA77|nr:type IV pilus modification protein PilV [Methylibium rhizosphaerae]